MTRKIAVTTKRYATSLLFSITLLSGCNAWSEDRDVRVMNRDTGKPEPGVMVLYWRQGSNPTFWSSTRYCDNEHLATTDQNGMVKVPSTVTSVPLRHQLLGGEWWYQAIAYKRGMVSSPEIETALGNPPHTFTKEERAKVPNLLESIDIRTDTRSAQDRALYLRKHLAGGCTCHELYKLAYAEAKEIYTPPLGTLIPATRWEGTDLCH